MNSKISNNIKIALIGCGNWGKNISRNLSQMNSLYCIYDPYSDIAKQVTTDLKLPNSKKVPELQTPKILSSFQLTAKSTN